jgi:hypothetical protein
MEFKSWINKSLLTSFVVHCAIVASIRTRDVTEDKVEQVTITLVEPKVIISKKTTGGGLSGFLPLLKKYTGKPGPSDEDEVSTALSDESDSSPLTRKSVLYSSYFDRIKEEMEPLWTASVRNEYRKKRLLEPETVTIVVIFDREGSVVKALLAPGSKNQTLQRLAIATMVGKKFPNPPDGLFDQDGLGRIVWYFSVR